MLDNFCEIKCDVDKYFGVLFYDFYININRVWGMKNIKIVIFWKEI